MKSWQTDQISEGAKVQVLVKSVVGRFEGLVASRFNRGRYRTLRALQDFLRQAGEITNLRPLALSIEKKVAEATGAEEVRLLVPSANGLAFTPISVTKWRSSNCPSLSASSPIVTWLRVHDDPCMGSADRRTWLLAPITGRALRLEQHFYQFVGPLEAPARAGWYPACSIETVRRPIPNRRYQTAAFSSQTNGFVGV